MMTDKQLQAVVVGASGYTGAELIRLLQAHPHVGITALTGDSKAGQTIDAVYPHLRDLGLPDLVTVDSLDWTSVDVAFCCLPHGASQGIIPSIPAHVVVIDLSADYRFKDPATYEQWYNQPHNSTDLLAEAAYGLSELYRDDIAAARLIACPGCYPTSVELPLFPLLQQELIIPDMLTIDAKSGVTGAGRSLKQGNLYCEANEGIGAYGVGGHRHCPEIEEVLSSAADRQVTVSFTPHLAPMNRGILSTIYASLDVGVTVEEVRNSLRTVYADSPFVTICEEGSAFPSTQQVRGSNRCIIGVYADRHPGRVIIVSVIDNLLKGASGQAIQNFNIRFGFDDTTGLGVSAIFP